MGDALASGRAAVLIGDRTRGPAGRSGRGRGGCDGCRRSSRRSQRGRGKKSVSGLRFVQEDKLCTERDRGHRCESGGWHSQLTLSWDAASLDPGGRTSGARYETLPQPMRTERWPWMVLT